MSTHHRMAASKKLLSGLIFLVAVFATVVLVAKEPQADAQVPLAEISTGPTSGTILSNRVPYPRAFSVTALQEGEIVQLNIDLPSQPTAGVISPSAYSRLLIGGTEKAREVLLNTGQVEISSLGRNPATGEITVTFAEPVPVQAGQQIEIQIAFAAAVDVSQATLHAWAGEPEPPREWTKDELTFSATQGSSPLVTMTENITQSGYVTGPIVARTENQNGYDLDGAKQTVVKILDAGGSVVYSNADRPGSFTLKPASALTGPTNGWGGIEDRKLKVSVPADGIRVEPGYQIVVEMPFRTVGAQISDPTALSPTGPGDISYRLTPDVPTTCEAGSSPLDRTVNGVFRPDPYPRPSGTSTSRMAPRELTNEEKQRGTSVYVTAASPSGQSRLSSQLYLQTGVSGEFVKIGEPTGWIVNALAFNSTDNYLYGISQGRDGMTDGVKEPYKNNTAVNGTDALFYEDPCYPAGHLLQIHPVTGHIVDLGKVGPGAGTTAENSEGYGFQGEYGAAWPNDLWGGVNAGFFDSQGSLWASNASISGSGAFYKVDINSVTATTSYPLSSANPSNDRRVSGDWGRAWRAGAEDYAVLPSAPNYAWGIVNAWNSGGRLYLERVNLTTGSKKRFNITGLRTPTGQRIAVGNQWSKAWVYGDGTLGLGTGSSGANSDVVRIAINNPGKLFPRFTLESVLRNAPTAYNTNGTSNGYSSPFSADLQVLKRREKIDNGRLYWWIDIWNNGPDGVSGFTLHDALGPEFNDIKLETIEQAAGLNVPSVVDTQGTSLTIQFGNLIARESGETKPQLSVRISAGLKDTNTPDACVANTVTVNSNENDPEIGNNTSTSSCDVELTKTAIDTNGDEKVDDNDVQGPDESGIYTVAYHVKLANVGSEPSTYDYVIDSPKLADAFTVQSVYLTGPHQSEAVKVEPSPENPEAYVLAEPGVLQKGEELVFKVEVRFTADQLQLTTDPALGKCSDEATGLVNSVSVGEKVAEDCVDFPKNKNMTLEIVKLSADGSQAPLPGAEFKLFTAAADGSLVQNAEHEVPVTSDGQGNFSAEVLTPGTYYLLETKAPEGMMLLAEPVKFSTQWNENGEAVLVVSEGGSSLIFGGAKGDSEVDRVIGLIQVADVSQGTLPKTGREGLVPYLLAAGTLLLAGVGFSRRQN